MDSTCAWVQEKELSRKNYFGEHILAHQQRSSLGERVMASVPASAWPFPNVTPNGSGATFCRGNGDKNQN